MMDEHSEFDNIDIQNEKDLFVSAVQVNDDDENGIITNGLHAIIETNESSVNGEPKYIKISVKDPKKVGEGFGSYLAYEVLTETNMAVFPAKVLAVKRRFSDFLGLHDKLCEKFLRNGRIIPPAPEKSLIGTTMVKMSSEDSNAERDRHNPGEFVERRRRCLERYLRRIALHPVLRVDPDFRKFLEAESVPRAINTSALSGAGVMRLFNKVGETVNKIKFKMDETDSWFEEKIQEVENLDVLLRKLQSNFESLVFRRRDLASSTAALAAAITTLSESETETELKDVLLQLSNVQKKLENIHIEQSNTDFYAMCELLRDYIGLLGSVKDAFHERIKVFQHFQHALVMLTKKREAKVKLQATATNDKIEQANSEVVDWEAKVERAQEEFNSISSMIKKEMLAFDAIRIRDFKQFFIQYFKEQMEHQSVIIEFWQTFLQTRNDLVKPVIT